MFHAWYSESYAKKFGWMNFLQENGEVIAVTSISSDTIYGHHLTDVVYVGQVKLEDYCSDNLPILNLPN